MKSPNSIYAHPPSSMGRFHPKNPATRRAWRTSNSDFCASRSVCLSEEASDRYTAAVSCRGGCKEGAARIHSLEAPHTDTLTRGHTNLYELIPKTYNIIILTTNLSFDGATFLQKGHDQLRRHGLFCLITETETHNSNMRHS